MSNGVGSLRRDTAPSLRKDEPDWFDMAVSIASYFGSPTGACRLVGCRLGVPIWPGKVWAELPKEQKWVATDTC